SSDLDRFSAVFFQPFYAGQTFGIGQLNPLTALQMSDIVAQVSKLPKLDHNNAQQVYKTIMDPDLTLAYVAATLKKSIEAYRDIAGFDTSENPGITATLYNIGNPEARARALRDENRKRAQGGESPRLPHGNYDGWLLNDRLGLLKGLFRAGWRRPLSAAAPLHLHEAGDELVDLGRRQAAGRAGQPVGEPRRLRRQADG